MSSRTTKWQSNSWGSPKLGETRPTGRHHRLGWWRLDAQPNSVLCPVQWDEMRTRLNMSLSSAWTAVQALWICWARSRWRCLEKLYEACPGLEVPLLSGWRLPPWPPAWCTRQVNYLSPSANGSLPVTQRNYLFICLFIFLFIFLIFYLIIYFSIYLFIFSKRQDRSL